MLVYIWFPLRPCLTTSRPHIWSSGRRWQSPSISSWLLSLPGEKKEEREESRRESKSGSQPRKEHITAALSLSLHAPVSAPVRSDSSAARPKGKFLPVFHIARYPCSSSHSPLTPLESYFFINCHILRRTG